MVVTLGNNTYFLYFDFDRYTGNIVCRESVVDYKRQLLFRYIQKTPQICLFKAVSGVITIPRMADKTPEDKTPENSADWDKTPEQIFRGEDKAPDLFLYFKLRIQPRF